MHFCNFECVLTILNDIIVGFIVQCDGCQLWAGESGKRVEEQAVESKTGEIDGGHHRDVPPR